METQTENLKTKTIEREFYVLTVNKLNKKSRFHTKETVQEWINALNNKNPEHFKIEYAIDVLEQEVKQHFINDSLYCGIVTSLELRGDDLYAKAKFKTKVVPNPEMLTNPEFFDNLTLVPKGKGNIKNNTIYNYEIYGFNLVEQSKSSFYILEEELKTEKSMTIDNSISETAEAENDEQNEDN